MSNPKKRREYWDPNAKKTISKTQYYRKKNIQSSDEAGTSSQSEPMQEPSLVETQRVEMDDNDNDNLPQLGFSVNEEDEDDNDSVPQFRLFDDEEDIDENDDRLFVNEQYDENQLFDIESDNEVEGLPTPGCTIDELKLQLADYLIRSKTPQKYGRELLKILRDAQPGTVFSGLPKDPRSLIFHSQVDKIATEITSMDSGEFVYIGIKNSLNHQNAILFDRNIENLSISVMVDGLPLFSTSSVVFWPILGRIAEYPIFVIALYKGHFSKPSSMNDFIEPFVQEMTDLIENGLEIGGKSYKLRLHHIAADAPARSDLLYIKRPNGYYSCSKCTVKGQRGEEGSSVVTYPYEDEDYPAREHADFYKFTQLQDERNVNELQLAKIPYINIVEDIPLDAMHMIYLGVTKKLLELWSTGPVKNRSLSSTGVNAINNILENNREYCPSEFQRYPRSLRLLSYWRAHEFRQFLLYVGSAVIDTFLPKREAEHFRMLIIYTRILSDPQMSREAHWQEYCVKLIKIFSQEMAAIYGQKYMVYNFHGLLHIPADVRKFGPIESYSCFEFESFLYTLKKLVRSGKAPLQQAVNRINELFMVGHYKKSQEITNDAVLSSEDSSQSTPTWKVFKKLIWKKLICRTTRKGDSFFGMNNDDIVQIDKIIQDNLTKEIFVQGRVFSRKESLYSTPDDSSIVSVYKCSNLRTTLQTFPIVNIKCKYYCIPVPDQTFVCSKLLHS